jgi:Asp-tRNA(Asn)/Glu-tRNA(Gln) amidotransferase A subunit family amidase
VIGLKPTHGLVPYTGIVGIDQTFDHVRDCVETVADESDELIRVTIGLVIEGFSEEAGIHPDVAWAVQEATDRFADLGATTKRVAIPEDRQAGGPGDDDVARDTGVHRLAPEQDGARGTPAGAEAVPASESGMKKIGETLERGFEDRALGGVAESD